MNLADVKPAARYYQLAVRVINHGSTDEQLTGLTIESADHAHRIDLLQTARRAGSRGT
jgi:hypothetical protein